MKKKALLIPLASLALFSCGESGDISSSEAFSSSEEEISGKDYIDMAKKAAISTSEEDNIRLSCIDVPSKELFSGQLGFEIRGENEEKTHAVFNLSKLSFDSRHGNVHSENQESSLSIPSGRLAISTDIEDLPSQLSDLSFNLGGLGLYEKEGYSYADLSTQTLLNEALDLLFDKLEEQGDYAFPRSNKLKWENGDFPLSEFDLTSLASNLGDAVEEAYEIAPSAFSFLKESDYSLSFSINDKQVIKSLLLSDEEGSLFTEERLDAYLDNSNIKKCKIDLSFSKEQLLSASLDIQINQVDTDAIAIALPNDDIYPYADFSLKGKLYFDIGDKASPIFPSDLEDYEALPEISWEDIEKLLPKEEE